MAMLLYSSDAQFDPLREIPFGSITTGYSEIGNFVVADAVEGGTTVLVSADHSVVADDLLFICSGDQKNSVRTVASVNTDLITVSSAFSGYPASGVRAASVAPDITADAEAGSTDTTITATAHGAAAGDLVCFIEGDEINLLRWIASKTDDTFTLDAALTGAPSAGEAFIVMTPDAADAVEATTTASVIKATGHAAAAGDLLIMKNGDEKYEVREVASVTTNTITLSVALSGAPSAGELFMLITPSDLITLAGGLSTTRLLATDHVAEVGDTIIMLEGGEDNEHAVVTAVSTDVIDLDTALTGVPTATETFNIQRPALFAKGCSTVKILHLINTLNENVYLSMDGTTDHMWLKAGASMSLDLKTNNLHFDADHSIFVRKDSSAPTSGHLRVIAIY